MIQRLIELGLSNYEASAYLALLKLGTTTPVDVARAAGVPKQRIYDVLSSLGAKGFCATHSTSPKTYTPTHPAIALQRLRQLQADEFRRQENRRIVEAKILLQHLEPIFKDSKDVSSELPSVELVRDQALAVGRFRELLRACANSVCFTVKIGSYSGAMFDAIRLQDMVLNKGVSCRAIVENPALSDPTIESWLAELVDAGASVRRVDHLPVQLSVFDSSHSMISVPEEGNADEASTSLVIQHVPTAEFIRFGFNKMWAEGSSLYGSSDANSQNPGKKKSQD